MIELKKICEELALLFHKKNLEYGAAYFADGQASDWFFELKRKYLRLNRININNGPKDAKIETLTDLAVYSIMELIRMRENDKI